MEGVIERAMERVMEREAALPAHVRVLCAFFTFIHEPLELFFQCILLWWRALFRIVYNFSGWMYRLLVLCSRVPRMLCNYVSALHKLLEEAPTAVEGSEVRRHVELGGKGILPILFLIIANIFIGGVIVAAMLIATMIVLIVTSCIWIPLAALIIMCVPAAVALATVYIVFISVRQFYNQFGWVDEVTAHIEQLNNNDEVNAHIEQLNNNDEEEE